MRAKILTVLVALFGLAALAAGGVGSYTPAVAPTATTADITYYVNVDGGNDSYACTDSSLPCATIQGAYNKIPTLIKNQVTVSVASGTYSGAILTGHTIAPSSSGTANSLRTIGTSITASGTDADGGVAATPTGTLSSSSLGTQPTLTTLTDSTATWGTNTWRDKLVQITSGTGSSATSYFPITSNTATTLTIEGTTTATASSGYTILDWGAVISTPIASQTGPFSLNHIPAADVIVEGNLSDGVNSGGITFERLKFSQSTSSTTGLQVEGPVRVSARWSFFTGSSTFDTGINMSRGAGGHLNTNVYDYNGTSGTGVNMGSTSNESSGVSISNSYFRGGATGLAINGPVSILTNDFFDTQTTTSIAVSQAIAGSVQAAGIKINGSANGLKAQGTSSGGVVAAIGMGTSDVSSCTTAGIILDGPLSTGIFGTITGSSNAIGWSFSHGAKAQIASGSSMTGTTEVSVDGTSTTLATMRGNSPKAYPSTASVYGTAFFE